MFSSTQPGGVLSELGLERGAGTAALVASDIPDKSCYLLETGSGEVGR